MFRQAVQDEYMRSHQATTGLRGHLWYTVVGLATLPLLQCLRSSSVAVMLVMGGIALVLWVLDYSSGEEVEVPSKRKDHFRCLRLSLKLVESIALVPPQVRPDRDWRATRSLLQRMCRKSAR